MPSKVAKSAVQAVNGKASTSSATPSHTEPTSKRRKHRSNGQTDQELASSSSPPAPRKIVSRNRLFAPFRALGLISNDVPFALQTRFGGKDATTPDVNVITCLGDSWAMWDAERMTLLFVSTSLQAPITSLVISLSPDAVLAAAGTKVYRFKRGKVDAVYDTVDRIMARFNKPNGRQTDSDDEDEESSDSDLDSVSDADITVADSQDGEGTQLSSLIVFGDTIAAISSDGRSVFTWSIASTELIRRIDLPNDFVASSLLHPATYLNKILIGSTDGQLALWNIRTGSLVHAYEAEQLRGAAAGPSSGASTAAIVNLTQSPAVDVVAVGFADGHVLLHDIRLDESLFSIHASGGLSSGSISFRSDGKQHSVAIATNSGNISIFDLEPASGSGPSSANNGPRLTYSIQDAHDGGVGSIEFVPGQPLLISSGGDNSCKQWFFESASMPPRLLKGRSGHHQPPHLIRYYGEEGKEILSAGRDRSIRSISVVRDSRSHELSQGELQKRSNQLSVSVSSLKLPAASSLSFSLTRSRDWDDVLTTHQGRQFANTWTVRDKRMGKKPLSASADKKIIAEARTGCVSACGNFALVGNSEGLVEAYNMQSYVHRRTYDTRPVDPMGPTKAKEFPAGSKKAQAALHARVKGSAVTGIATDALNRFVIISTMDGKLSWYDFTSTDLLHRTTISASGISSIQLHRDSNLLLVVSDDLVLRLVDIETRRVVREFVGFRGRILDACFSNDARWIVATSMDAVIRTFDIPSSRLIDAFKVASIATSVTFSPTGDFLATAHVDSVGIYLWANKAQFSPVALQGLDELAEVVEEDEDATAVALPTVQGDIEDAALAEFSESMLSVGEPELQRVYTSPPQLVDSSQGEGGLVTLSTMPRARWMTLINLDTIKLRNKPKSAPQKPDAKRAPFFLPQTVSGVDFKFDPTAPAGEDAEAPEQGERSTIFSSGGVSFKTEFQERLDAAVEKGDVSGFFLYLETLSTPQLDLEIRSLSNADDLVSFLTMLLKRLKQHRDYEAVQALLATLLKVHTDLMLQIVNPSANEVDGEDEEMDDEFGEVDEEEVKKLKSVIRKLIRVQVAESNRLNGLLDHCLGTLAFLRGLPMT
ncbi:Small-subunit processome, Utp21 [Kalmanozyma brasiliensis GHG001]|uniref:Small-subunit processome Utp21 domain-containing protein n=1 Tax=Kalmanozyma brasiliensis (strain GHG001) TaxID=1365824 RepID=V5F125_KALBG|nr:Small-subunit processome, Utp21 [Kalmanozyma brasiliensis GHG001]EST08974.1 Small-subunit processome, Utp21 [Kalmanozyma brasiliensis GHG001]